jgi:hypothetical protein
VHILLSKANRLSNSEKALCAASSEHALDSVTYSLFSSLSRLGVDAAADRRLARPRRAAGCPGGRIKTRPRKKPRPREGSGLKMP